jgi:hypothetical protein
LNARDRTEESEGWGCDDGQLVMRSKRLNIPHNDLHTRLGTTGRGMYPAAVCTRPNINRVVWRPTWAKENAHTTSRPEWIPGRMSGFVMVEDGDLNPSHAQTFPGATAPQRMHPTLGKVFLCLVQCVKLLYYLKKIGIEHNR